MGVPIKLIKKEEAALGTMAFHFEKPAGFNFKAGQFCDWSLINPTEMDDEGGTRAFSIASAPYEPDLMIASRMRNTAFKRILKKLKIGGEISVEGPFGSFTLHNNSARPAILLAGGIGITPFRSMIIQAAHERLPHKIYLFYSNRRPQDAAFLDELIEVQQKYLNFKIVPTMTEVKGIMIEWDGETGYINKEMLVRYLADLADSIYYAAGPPAMVKAMREMLAKAGINDDDIRTEEFSGY